MSFIKEIIDYSGFNLPFNATSLPPHIVNTWIDASITLGGVTNNVRGWEINITSWDLPFYSGVDVSSIPDDTIMYKIKTKNGVYIFFVLKYASTYNGHYIAIYFSLESELNENAQVLNGYYYSELKTRGFKAFITILNNRYLGVFFDNSAVNYLGTLLDMAQITELYGDIESRKFSPDYGSASEEGGYSGGSFDNSSDIITIPIKPSIGVTNVGFVNVYAPNENALANLGSELFPDFTPVPTIETSDSVPEMIARGFTNLGDNIVNFTNMFINSNLINYVIDCHIIPVAPTVSNSENIKIGFKQFNQTAVKVTSDYIDFDCGILNIKEYYTNFIDYVGTRAKLYLPFVGFVPIENEYFQNGLLQVIYRFNVIDGSFMAYVLSSSSKSELSNSVIASYGGNACVHIPITGLNYASMMSGVLTGTVATIGAATVSPVSGIVTGLASAMNTLASKPSMQSSNGYNSTSAYLGVRFPYLIIEREVSNFSELYPHENGFPCNITKTISEMNGYFEMSDIHIETLTATEEEKEMVLELLQNGVVM